jgi:hypothetical protein
MNTARVLFSKIVDLDPESRRATPDPLQNAECGRRCEFSLELYRLRHTYMWHGIEIFRRGRPREDTVEDDSMSYFPTCSS